MYRQGSSDRAVRNGTAAQRQRAVVGDVITGTPLSVVNAPMVGMDADAPYRDRQTTTLHWRSAS